MYVILTRVCFLLDYSCAFNGRQGWLYLSENYIAFYSFLLGVETKKLIEMKDVQDITKEKSKRSMFSDSLRIKTKDEEEVCEEKANECVDLTKTM